LRVGVLPSGQSPDRSELGATIPVPYSSPEGKLCV
jgi:hypothetical protein